MALAGFFKKSIGSEGCEGGEYPSGDFPGPDFTARGEGGGGGGGERATGSKMGTFGGLVILAVAEELTEQASKSG